MTDELKENVYVEFALHDTPNLHINPMSLNEWLDCPENAILKANVVNFDIKTDKNYGYLMFTIFITM